MENFSLVDFRAFVITLVVFTVLYYLFRWILKRRMVGNSDSSLVTQSILFSIVVVGLIATPGV